jgi:iron(III) transport system ATP-binding protein
MDQMADSAVPGVAASHIRIRHLTKRFGTFAALRDVTLEIKTGELVCFLGPSGCGKTTLLRVIAGLEKQDEGTVEIGGRDVSDLPPAARDFGIVFQSYALFPNLSVNDNVAYGLVNRGSTRASRAARVAELLTLVGMPEQGTKYPAQLSGGQQQRVALARALATAPGLLLLDEPLSALDARVRARLRDEIRMLQRRLGVTTILVTHDQEEALAMADRIVVMNEGTIEQIGTPAQIYARPSSAFVADFVGKMTFLNGTVQLPGLDLTVAEALDAAPGTSVRLGVRPEEVQVRGVTAETANQVDVDLAAIEYLGAFCRLTLTVPSSSGLILTADVSSNEMHDLNLTAGQRIKIALPEQHVRVFGVRGGRQE